MDKMRRLEGRVAIVTGGGSGIGAATVRRLAMEGAVVVSADIDKRAATQIVAEIGGEGAARQVDVRDRKSVDELVAWTLDTYGRLDVMHNKRGNRSKKWLVGNVPNCDPRRHRYQPDRSR